MKTILRKIVCLCAAVVLYYIIHEGGHLFVALITGTFQEIRIVAWGMGVEIVADTSAMSNFELFIGSAAGVICTTIVGYTLVFTRKNIQKVKNKFVRSFAYYGTLILLLLDPLYLSVLYRFVGGGDMNGILLSGVPEIALNIFFAALLVVNLFVVIKVILPSYKQSFMEQ